MSVFKRHPSSTIAAILAVLLALPALIDSIQGAAEPFGVPPSVYVYATAGIGAAIILGQLVQRVVANTQNFGWTLPKVIGFVLGALSLAQPVIDDLSETLTPFDIDPSVWVKVGSAITIITLIGAVVQTVLPGTKETRPVQP